MATSRLKSNVAKKIAEKQRNIDRTKKQATAVSPIVKEAMARKVMRQAVTGE